MYVCIYIYILVFKFIKKRSIPMENCDRNETHSFNGIGNYFKQLCINFLIDLS